MQAAVLVFGGREARPDFESLLVFYITFVKALRGASLFGGDPWKLKRPAKVVARQWRGRDG
jgi:hypothetical protein